MGVSTHYHHHQQYQHQHHFTSVVCWIYVRDKPGIPNHGMIVENPKKKNGIGRHVIHIGMPVFGMFCFDVVPDGT